MICSLACLCWFFLGHYSGLYTLENTTLIGRGGGWRGVGGGNKL